MANVLAVFAHPDDEVLGCGGTLAKHAEQGDKVLTFVYAIRGLREEYEAAALVLGTSPQHADYPDQRLDTVPFVDLVAELEPWDNADVIYTHHPGDLNLDHALVARAVLTAFRPKPGVKPCTILACEVLSSTEYTYPRVFQPNWYVALEGEQVRSAEYAMDCYESQVQPWPHPRNGDAIGGRADMCGSEIGVMSAEAFQLLRAGPF